LFEQGLYQLLTQDQGDPLTGRTSVASLIGDRAFWLLAPKETRTPFVVMQLVVTQDTYSAQGANKLRIKHVQFDSYGTTSTDPLTGVVVVSDAIRKLLQSFSGQLPDGTPINGCIVTRDMDMGYEPGTSGYEFRRLLEVQIQHTDN
jgi:hypothetical protein